MEQGCDLKDELVCWGDFMAVVEAAEGLVDLKKVSDAIFFLCDTEY